MTSDTQGMTIRLLTGPVIFLLGLGFALTVDAEAPPGDGVRDTALREAAAREVATREPVEAAPDTAPVAGTSRPGLRVYLDPETGEITDRPTAAQVEKLSRALELSLLRTAEDLEPFDLSGGGQGLFLAGRFRSAAIARRRADGGFDVSCVETVEEAEHLLATPVPADGPPADGRFWEEK